MTLHEAIEKVLKEAGKPLTATRIADRINEDKLYSGGEGEPVPASQINARINKYPSWFNKTKDGLISLAAERIDPFRDAVYQVLDSLRSSYILDVSYLLTTLFFYKRWLDYPEMLLDCNLNIEIDKTDSRNPDAFRSFYVQMKSQLSKRNKNFDTEIIDSLYAGNQDLFREAVTSLQTALKVLDKISFSINSYTVNDFGRRFSGLFTGSYTSIKKSGEQSTPESLRKLMISLVNTGPDDLVYNPAAGLFAFPSALQRRSEQKIRFYGEELNPVVFSLGLLNLIANGASIENAYLGNSLTSSEIKDESAALVICNPPFNILQNHSLYDGLYPFKSRNGTIYFLQLALKKLKPGGEAIVVIPENILFSGEGGIMQLRKYLVENNLVDSVISLPSGTFEPYSMVKSSVIILKKERPLNRILFFDADRNEYYSKGNKNIFILKSGLISEQFGKLKVARDKISAGGSDHNPEELMLQEEKAEYILPSRNYALMTYEDVRENEFNLDVKRYFFSDIAGVVHENGSGRIVELKSVLRQYRNKVMSCAESGLPYLSISDLNADFTKFTFNDYGRLRNEPKHRGQLIDSDNLMVGAVEGSLKPTYFKFTGHKILISADVYAFTADTGQVDPEYLVYELAGNLVNEQIRLLTRGTAIKRISGKDLLRVRIRLPESLTEQHKIVNAKKEALVQTRIRETENLAARLKVSAAGEREMLGAFNHELSPHASSLKGDTRTLSKYLVNKINENSVPQMTEKVTAANLSRSLSELLADMETSAERLLGLSNNIHQILDVAREDIKFDAVKIKSFIRDQVQTWDHHNEYNIVYHGEEESAPDFTAAINREQFSILLRNFLENTHRHGYMKGKNDRIYNEWIGPQRNMVFNAFLQDNMITIEMINDGLMFPEDFTFEDFIRFGGRGGLLKGSGIGGFLMNKIAENHKGQFQMIEARKTLVIPQAPVPGSKNPLSMRQITTGIYFRIILPKTNPE